jgi:hypothetical protein
VAQDVALARAAVTAQDAAPARAAAAASFAIVIATSTYQVVYSPLPPSPSHPHAFAHFKIVPLVYQPLRLCLD